MDATGGKITQCPFCGYRFDSGVLRGEVYCPRCGGHYPLAGGRAEETVLRTPGGGRLPSTEAAAEPEAPLRRFGPYDLVEEIGRGGMGIVYRAYDRRRERIVALKLLREGDVAGPRERERLMREAATASRLAHPNIVPVHECATFRGQPYFTMDFVEGTSLERRLEDEGPMPSGEACLLMEKVARAMAYAHGQGVVHRDLKPGNILLDADGAPRITDFGLAIHRGPAAAPERLTRHGDILGTLPYMPPEQAHGHHDEIDARSDVYSLGAVLYECLAGRPPFTGGWTFDLVQRVIRQEPPSPRKFRAGIPREAELIALKCLAKNPARRYPDALALAEACHSFAMRRGRGGERTDGGLRRWLAACRLKLTAAFSRSV